MSERDPIARTVVASEVMAVVTRETEQNSLRGVLRHALDPSRYPIEAFEPKEGRAMRWPSGIAGVDNRVALEGFYGVTTIYGKMKLGKSIAASCSAFMAAQSGFHVVYVDAELDQLQITTRIMRFGRGPEWWNSNHASCRIRMLNEPASLARLVEDIASQVPLETTRLLLVLDSVSRIAEAIEEDSHLVRPGRRHRPIDYWTAQKQLVRWAMSVRRLAPAQIGVLVTAEENSQGKSKGQQLEYAGDMTLQINGEQDSDIAQLDVRYSREGGAGVLDGTYRRDWAANRFELVRRADEMTGRPTYVM